MLPSERKATLKGRDEELCSTQTLKEGTAAVSQGKYEEVSVKVPKNDGLILCPDVNTTNGEAGVVVREGERERAVARGD